MHTIDWLAVILPVVAILGVAVYTRRFVKGVADFLAGGRCANRYLLANARGAADVGLVNAMSRFEVILVSGFVLNYWDSIPMPVLLLVSLSGFVVYRFRETRALTLAQFFEMRYSHGFRIFMGGLAFLAGILNYGIFPAVASRFFVYFLDLPHQVALFGLMVPTFALIMAGYLSLALGMLLIGGQVTLMVADCVEGIFSHLVYMLIVVVLFLVVSWDQVVQVMSSAPPGKSMIDPFDAGQVPDFNFGFAVMATILNVYTALALQNRQGFNAAARTPHEARMGGVLGNWRMYARTLITVALGICAVTFLQHSDFATVSAPAHDAIKAIPDPYIQKQMTVPVALRYLLPMGIKGLFVAIMAMGLLASDAAHMHSWGSIFVQDVLLPLRKTSLSPESHIRVLKTAMAGVVVFAFLFSILWSQTQYIQLWWAITGGMFTAGAGAAIVGGLYWRRGTRQAAWASTIGGSVLALIGIVLGSKAWPHIAGWLESRVGLDLPEKFWFNYQKTIFLVAIVTALVYIGVSYLTCRERYNLDRLLHRGEYADAKDSAVAKVLPWRERIKLSNILRFDQNFTVTDKVVTASIFLWSMLLLVVNIVITTWNVAFERWSIAWWDKYWLIVGIGIPFVIALGSLFWFGIGGIIDMKSFFIALRTIQRDDADDGRVAPALAEKTAAAKS